MMISMQPEKYALLDKTVGKTPLEVLENWRLTRPDLEGVPLAYAGRLDPMASGQLLILVGEECKNQVEYHNLDKEYQVGILFGVSSDSGDVLGITEEHARVVVGEKQLLNVLESFIGPIELPYPIFSSKTVQGKPLHTWAVEKRLDEIEIPTRKSEIYSINILSISTYSRKKLVLKASSKIESIPLVTDPRKALGNDFRRPEVRKAWGQVNQNGSPEDIFYIANISCICSSGTYMRTLAEEVAKKFDTKGLAFSINRSRIGNYNKKTADWTRIF
jgi:tRNA pseudouridine(55) synthase